jgi:hypothetical protein
MPVDNIEITKTLAAKKVIKIQGSNIKPNNKLPDGFIVHETDTSDKNIYIISDTDVIPSNILIYEGDNKGHGSIVFPEGIKTIGTTGKLINNNGNEYVKNISIHLPESLESINTQAFYSVVLKTLRIPCSVKNIGSKCFAALTSDTPLEVILEGKNTLNSYDDIFFAVAKSVASKTE